MEGSKLFFSPFQSSVDFLCDETFQTARRFAAQNSTVSFSKRFNYLFLWPATNELHIRVYISWGGVLHRSDKEMPIRPLKSNRSCAPEPTAISAVINSSATTLTACLLVVTVRQGENFNKTSSHSGRSMCSTCVCMHTAMCIHLGHISRRATLQTRTPALALGIYGYKYLKQAVIQQKTGAVL